ncbi:MAG TPA: glycosyltransferase family 39 protein [Ktedonobacterales bacterium]
MATELDALPLAGDPHGGHAERLAMAEHMLALARPPRRWALAAILLLAACCDFYALQREGYANLYYAAAIRSMLESWHNFFFVAFDPGGFVSVDKPPLGFWVQAASAKLLGFSGFSILLPEALAGVASVGVLYMLVRRIFGSLPALLAALALAITPVSVVTNRNNTIDSLLVLTVLLAAYAVSRAVESGSLRWLLLCALLVGLGFNIKMLEAYLVVPALAAVYLLGAPLGWWKRLWHLAVAGVVMLAVSLSWVVAVDLTPASARPYVGSSGSNSELALALGYNGIQRLLGNLFRLPAQVANATSTVAVTAPGGPGGASENGAQGVFRLLNAQLGGQASWLLALGLLGMLATGWGFRPGSWLLALPARVRALRLSAMARAQAHLTPQQSVLVLWGVWTLTQAVFFSVAGFFHRYYLSMLAPGIAALAGIGVVLLWRDYRDLRSPGAAGWRGWLPPAVLVVTAITQAVILADYPDWNRWMTPLILGGSLMVAAVLVLQRAARLRADAPWRRYGAEMTTPAMPAGAITSHYLEADVVTPPTEGVGQPSGDGRERHGWTQAAESWRGSERLGIVPLLAAALGVALLLVGPAMWTGVSLANGGGGTLPAAGPAASAGASQPGVGFARGRGRGAAFPGGFQPGGPAGFGGGPPGGFPVAGAGVPPAGTGGGQPGNGTGAQVDRGLIAYLEAHQGSSEYLFATLSSQTAAPYIIATSKPVMTLGGFSGSDQILTLSQLEALIRAGKVHYFLLSGGGGIGGPVGAGGSGNSQLVQWVEAQGTAVTVGGTTLYYVPSSAAN